MVIRHEMGTWPEAPIPTVGTVISKYQNGLRRHYGPEGPAALAFARGAVAGHIRLFDCFAIDG